MELLEKTKTLPTGSGVYIFKDADGEVIYVGKAKNLRNRGMLLLWRRRRPQPKVLPSEGGCRPGLHPYRNRSGSLSAGEPAHKKHRPRYNVRLKDDKEYPI